MDIGSIIAKNIRFGREEAGLSQEEVASRLGLGSHSAVSGMEAGTRRVSASELASLGELFRRSVDWFFDPDASKEDFVALARAQGGAPGVSDALREAERFLEHFVMLKKMLKATR